MLREAFDDVAFAAPPEAMMDPAPSAGNSQEAPAVTNKSSQLACSSGSACGGGIDY